MLIAIIELVSREMSFSRFLFNTNNTHFVSLGKCQFYQQISLLRGLSSEKHFPFQLLSRAGVFGKHRIKSRTLSMYFQNSAMRLHSNHMFIMA